MHGHDGARPRRDGGGERVGVDVVGDRIDIDQYGIAPSLATTPAVAKNEYVDVMTSSPGLISSAMSASSNTSVPDDTAIVCWTPIRAASSLSSCVISGPMMKR